ncbi:MAG TPA: protein phosphatase 2C domain-containing protein [Blastocatellia bacterium]|nr:protein phosphatase 2C domain-containing protein [Blastocatellia bacterium]
MRYIPGNAQDIGAREEQQDAFGFSDFQDMDFAAHGGFLGVVADGMGGLACGSEASRVAAQTFISAYRAKQVREPIPDALLRALRDANTAVVSMARARGMEGFVGTTLAGAAVSDDLVYWISAGDSRVYLLRNGSLTQLTTDHVYANELNQDVAQGKISRMQALNDPERDDLTSYLGIGDLVEIDRSLRGYPLEPGDRILLCSDGLYRALSEGEIAAMSGDSPQEACENLVRQALGKREPFQDNVTLLTLVRAADARPPGGAGIGPIALKLAGLIAAVFVIAASGLGVWRWMRPRMATGQPNGQALDNSRMASRNGNASNENRSAVSTESPGPRTDGANTAREGTPGKPDENDKNGNGARNGNADANAKDNKNNKDDGNDQDDKGGKKDRGGNAKSKKEARKRQVASAWRQPVNWRTVGIGLGTSGSGVLVLPGTAGRCPAPSCGPETLFPSAPGRSVSFAICVRYV